MFERLSWLGRLALSIELVRGIAGSAAAAAASELMLASLSFSKLVRGAKPPAKPRVWCHGGPCGGTAVSPATPCGDPAVSIMSGVERLRSLSRLARLLELLVPCRLSSVGPKSAARLLVEPPCPSTASARACSRASTSAALGVSSAPVLWLDWLPPLRCRGTPVMLLLKLLLPLPPAASTSAVSTTPPGTMKGRDILPCVLGCGGPRRCATATLRRQAGRLAGWRAGGAQRTRTESHGPRKQGGACSSPTPRRLPPTGSGAGPATRPPPCRQRAPLASCDALRARAHPGAAPPPAPAATSNQRHEPPRPSPAEDCCHAAQAARRARRQLYLPTWQLADWERNLRKQQEQLATQHLSSADPGAAQVARGRPSRRHGACLHACMCTRQPCLKSSHAKRRTGQPPAESVGHACAKGDLPSDTLQLAVRLPFCFVFF